MLERPHQAEASDRRGLQPVDPFAFEPDLAGMRFEKATDEVERRALAGSVRTDQAQNLGREKLAGKIGHRRDAAEMAGQPFDTKQRGGTHDVVSVDATSVRRRAEPRPKERYRSKTPIKPSGMNSIVSTIADPNSSVSWAPKPIKS